MLAQSIFVRRSPSDVLGRVFAALQGVIGAAMLVATGLGGMLLGVLGVRPVIVGSGVLAVVALLAVSRPLLAARDTEPASSGTAADAAAQPALAAEGGDAA